MMSSEIKRKCIEMAKTKNLNIVAATFNVPLKSLKRWLVVGSERKKGILIVNLIGGGRKVRDPEMEERLYNWYLQYRKVGNKSVTAKMIKKKALDFSKFDSFSASKGWLEKYKRKYNIILNKEWEVYKMLVKT